MKIKNTLKNKFTKRIINNIRKDYKKGIYTQKKLAKRYGCCQGTIHRYIHYNNPTQYNEKLAKKKGYRNFKDYQKKLIIKKGYPNWQEYYDDGAKKKGFKNLSTRNKSYLNQKGIKNNFEYEQKLANKKGFKTPYEYRKNHCKKKGYTVHEMNLIGAKKRGVYNQKRTRQRLTTLLNKAIKRSSSNKKVWQCSNQVIEYSKIIKKLKPTKDKLKVNHIDHIIPINVYDLSDIKEIKKAFNPKNLRWLKKEKNLKKKDNIVKETLDLPESIYPKKCKQSIKFWKELKNLIKKKQLTLKKKQFSF